MRVPRGEFRLQSEFLDRYSGKQPDWGPLGYLTFKRTYALDLPDGTTEEFWQTCQRVIEGMFQVLEGHCRHYNLPWSDAKAQERAQEAYERMFAFKWLPPGRGLSKMGTETMFRIGSACLNNCGFVSTKDIGNPTIEHAFSSPFCWLMDMSMLGVGVGFDTKGAGTVEIRTPKQFVPFIVGDSREGWVSYVQQLLESYADSSVPFPVADYSHVRPKGAKIKGFGGTSSGPEALMLLTKRVVKLLDGLDGKTITSSAIVDVANFVGECVVSGGVRRTAEIGFGKPDDTEFLKLKDYENNPEARELPRWASNNSVIVNGGPVDFQKLAGFTARNGEPGYLFIENARRYGRMIDPENHADMRAEGANPCVEQTLWNYELCCLVENFPARCDDYEDFERTLKFSYLYAKTVTLIPTHDPRTNAVMTKNRRIGCSQSGIWDNIHRVGLREHLKWCDRGYKAICSIDEEYSDWLGVRESIKKTSVKPSGSLSKLVGAREGIHQAKGEYEIQSIRINENSALLPRLRAANIKVEKAIYEPNTMVAYFPMHWPGQRDKPASMWEQLELAAQMQAYWADNQVSVTVDFDQEQEGPEIGIALEMYASRLKGLSFLPRCAEQHYKQLPKRVCSREEYEAYKAEVSEPDFTGIRTHEVDDLFCDGTTCEIRVG
jgi:adenosylcobalamin-dependent ribonucleoside-triphosphate reductase